MISQKDRKGIGRPKNYVCSPETRAKISRGKMGHTHTIETREKISRSMKLYRRKQNPLSNDLLRLYKKYPEAKKWIEENKDKIDLPCEVRTLSQEQNVFHTEVPSGNFVEIQTHVDTPEEILIAKETFMEILWEYPEKIFD